MSWLFTANQSKHGSQWLTDLGRPSSGCWFEGGGRWWEREGTGVQCLPASARLAERRWSPPTQPPPHLLSLHLDPGVDFGFLPYHASRISLIGGRIVFLTFSILICTKGMMAQGLAEAEWKLIQFGKVSKLGNNWNTEVPLLDWPQGNTFSPFDELNFRLDVYFIGDGESRKPLRGANHLEQKNVRKKHKFS